MGYLKQVTSTRVRRVFFCVYANKSLCLLQDLEGRSKGQRKRESARGEQRSRRKEENEDEEEEEKQRGTS